MHAFVDGYHTGLLVTIALLAAGVVLSYLTLRPRSHRLPTPGRAWRSPNSPLSDELAAELMADPAPEAPEAPRNDRSGMIAAE